VSERGQGALIERMVHQHPGHALLAALGLLLIGMLVWSLAAVPQAHDWSTRHTVASDASNMAVQPATVLSLWHMSWRSPSRLLKLVGSV